MQSIYVEDIIDIDSSKLGPCPWHFNCSILEDRDGYLLGYRCSEVNPHLRTVHLDENFIPDQDTDKRISFINESPSTFYEDPRLFKINGENYISYTSYSYDNFYCWVGYNKIDYDNKLKSQFPRFKANSWAGGIEKNWNFFENDDKIYFVYSINPHIVCEANGSGVPIKIYETRYVPMWELGVKRGGTPPVRIGDYYYSFFHSRSDDNGKAKYHVGFYYFDAKPPFPILGIVYQPIFSGEEYNAHDKAVVFPCGSVFKDGKWIVSYGYNDMACKVTIIDHDKMMKDIVKPQRLRQITCLKDRMVGVPCGFKYGQYMAHNWTGLRTKVPSDISDETIETHLCMKLIEMGADHFVNNKFVL